jgi:hypothetical protein
LLNLSYSSLALAAAARNLSTSLNSVSDICNDLTRGGRVIDDRAGRWNAFDAESSDSRTVAHLKDGMVEGTTLSCFMRRKGEEGGGRLTRNKVTFISKGNPDLFMWANF